MEILVFYVLGIIISVILNLLVIVVLLSKKSKVNLLDLSIVSLSISDLLQSGIGYSLEIYGFIKEEWVDDSTCKGGGFAITFLALVSICHLVGISIERFAILRFPLKVRAWCANPKVALYIIIPCWSYAFVCSLPPLLGWSSYRRLKEGYFVCSVDLNSSDVRTESYLWFLLGTCFILPMLLLVGCSLLILREANKITKEAIGLGITEQHAVRRRLDERKHALMVIAIISAYTISWSPYAICVCVLTAKGTVGDELLLFSAIFAKISTVYNPLIYSLFIKTFRERCMALFGFKRSSTTTKSTATAGTSGGTSSGIQSTASAPQTAKISAKKGNAPNTANKDIASQPISTSNSNTPINVSEILLSKANAYNKETSSTDMGKATEKVEIENTSV